MIHPIMILLKLCRNCAFLQNFHTRKLGISRYFTQCYTIGTIAKSKMPYYYRATTNVKIP